MVVLIRADSPEEAYQYAMALGAESEMTYENPARKKVAFIFRGLRDLSVIHGELEHGTEISYYEEALEEAAIQSYICPRHELSVFAPATRSEGPDYSSREVLEKLYETYPHLKPADWRD
ncbi:MAG: DUF4288 domain-containing protein [Acidobacteriia bacterium]|nr:DUF4288 domain-containing protein [Terriglobia bacterium]